MPEKIKKISVTCDIVAFFKKNFLKKRTTLFFLLLLVSKPILTNFIFLEAQRTELFNKKF